MKVRSGFVSNSSSSSFVVIGEHIEFSDLTKEIVENKNIMGFGKWLESGMDVFNLCVQVYDLLKENPKLLDEVGFDFYEVYKASENGGDFKRDELPEKFSVKATEADHSSSEDLKRFIDNYYYEFKDLGIGGNQVGEK